MQAILLQHYVHGGYYPIGGASEIAFNIIPVIEKNGGKVLVRAKVTEILVDGNDKVQGKAYISASHLLYAFSLFTLD